MITLALNGLSPASSPHRSLRACAFERSGPVDGLRCACELVANNRDAC